MIQYTTAWLSRIDLGELEPGSLKTTLEHLMVLTQKSYGERSDLLERLFSFLAEKEVCTRGGGEGAAGTRWR